MFDDNVEHEKDYYNYWGSVGVQRDVATIKLFAVLYYCFQMVYLSLLNQYKNRTLEWNHSKSRVRNLRSCCLWEGLSGSFICILFFRPLTVLREIVSAFRDTFKEPIFGRRRIDPFLSHLITIITVAICLSFAAYNLLLQTNVLFMPVIRRRNENRSIPKQIMFLNCSFPKRARSNRGI